MKFLLLQSRDHSGSGLHTETLAGPPAWTFLGFDGNNHLFISHNHFHTAASEKFWSTLWCTFAFFCSLYANITIKCAKTMKTRHFQSHFICIYNCLECYYTQDNLIGPSTVFWSQTKKKWGGKTRPLHVIVKAFFLQKIVTLAEYWRNNMIKLSQICPYKAVPS